MCVNLQNQLLNFILLLYFYFNFEKNVLFSEEEKNYTADKICLSSVRILLPWVINRDARFRDRSCDNELVQRRGLTKCIR